jgi:FkbM family methyltransferase
LIKKHDPRLYDEISHTLHRFYVQGDRGNDLVIADLNNVRLDGHPDYVEEMLSRKEPHDEDYIIFRSFQDGNAAILDVGANWGYSAGSIWAAGASCKVVSFEAIPLYRDCLERIARLKPHLYNYVMMALSSSTDILRFNVPVVNGTALTALTSASANPHLDSLAQNIHHSIIRWMPNVDDVTLKICEFEVPVQTLDDVISNSPGLIPNHGIHAIKLDVEGLEYQILKGAMTTLSSHTPLIMTEGGNRQAGLQELMVSLGYLYAERKDDKLIPVSGTGTKINGFFYHRDRIGEYRSRQILELELC